MVSETLSEKLPKKLKEDVQENFKENFQKNSNDSIGPRKESPTGHSPLQQSMEQSMERKYRQRKIVNGLMCSLLALSAVIALIPLFSVFGYVVFKGYPALNLTFFTHLPQPVGEVGGGMANAMVGTISLILIASALGVPWGIATGLYLSEYGRGRFSTWVRFSADMLTSIPSIIIGLFVYSCVVIPMKRFSALAGGIALGIIMVPTIARSVEELLKMVPTHIREAGLGLGLPRWKVILNIVLVGSAKAIATGIMLSVARVAGETAPLLFTAFGNSFWQRGLDQPIASLPAQIYTYAISPYDEWRRQAWGGSLVLVLLVFSMNLATRFLIRQGGRSNR